MAALRALLAAALLMLALPMVQAEGGSAPGKTIIGAPPTVTEVEFYTRPLIRARLRIPTSLHAFAVTAIKPTADDPARFAVELRFRAKTPFGGITEHKARFQMKRASNAGTWIVTAE